MEGFAWVPDPAISVAKGIPLSEEPGLGTLTVSGWLREVTGQFGPREALVQPRPDGSTERWTYADLWDRSMEVARSLVACGLGKGDRVGILATNRAEFISAFLGTVLAGGTAAPLSTFSTPGELDQLIMASCCSVLIVEPNVLGKDFVEVIADLDPAIEKTGPDGIVSERYPFLRHAIAMDLKTVRRGFEPWNVFLRSGKNIPDAVVAGRAASVTPADAAGLFFSSGSTGRPKGILNSHRGIAIQLWRWPRIFGLRSDERVWVLNGFFWSAPFGMGLGGALSIGGTLVLLSTFDPEKAIALIEAERITCPMGWPHQWAQLVAAPNFTSADLSSLRCVHPENPISQHPTVSTDWQEPTRIYGNTETFTLSTGYCSGTPEEILRGAHGFPLPGMTVKVRDPFTGEALPMGERGELAVKGATLMLGYAGVPIDETFDDEGYFPTGDGGYIDAEGRVFWEGRLNDIIKTGGANVSPVEVDGILLQCPGVKIVKTVGIPDSLLGEMVVCCVVAHEGAAVTEAGVRAFAKEHLASFKVPRRVVFLSEDQLSQTGSAKVKTADLRTLVADILETESV
ncbi:class I adenylate-forming enzyme family protein [Novosphingobium album (ex Hu et al. 2023)]|uniref:Acyl--CoA ligase n=1 Tax=Novosphingobium album (ex Hu et al. 2023) TaxID=2930093 RepID=A0ABT0B704_9SPHN|nr:class I adenylate-forming enzyme family protein [Novosphingobium album (ex Hu et al. 2023)]MCJ2180862.1 acyl--CoA ligase [Novosphingobium album (ex Hu et al. 2023)]